MRRLALSVFTACGLALLTACGSSGGYGFSTSGNSTGSVDQVILSAGKNGQTNDFFVAPGGTAPLQIDAIGQKGSGPAALIVPDTTFTWAARYVTASDPASLTQYQVGPAPASPKSCGIPSGTPAVTVYQSVIQNGLPHTIPLPPSQSARTVFIVPDPTVTFVAKDKSGAALPSNYCLVVQATHTGDGVIGAHVVVVSNSP